MNEEGKKTEPQTAALTEAELRYWAAVGLLGSYWPGEVPDDYETLRSREDAGSELLLQASRMGCGDACDYAAQLIRERSFLEDANLEKVYSILLEAVVDGNEKAEMELARLVARDLAPSDQEILHKAALRLWKDRNDLLPANRLMGRAARMSYIPAMKDYAQMLREGVGCEKDTALAAEIEWQAEEIGRGK